MLKKYFPIQTFLFLAAFFFSTLSFAQKTTSKKSNPKKSASKSNSGMIGLGVKAGDPTGLSVKFYQPKLDIELVVGRPYYFNGRYYSNKGYNNYYSDRFYKYKKYNGYYFYDYEAGNPIAFQAHFLKSKGTKSAKELSWYYGAGPQIRSYRVHYFYREYYNNNRDYFLRDDYHTFIDLGLDGVLGLEYTFSDLPLSIFGDVNLFLELADDPLHLELQGGLGVRYNIK
jgi:hypothetical protein